MELQKNIKILLVEDAGVMRQMELKTLNSLGFTNVIQAENGKKAVEHLQNDSKVELIISDWNMPEMDGFELLKWVRSNDSTKDIPFLMATGRGEKKEIESASSAGVSSFISKPFNNAELLEKMNEAFGIKNESDEIKEVNYESKITSSGKVKLKAIHIQITDHLTLGVIKHLIKKKEIEPKHFELETECMSSWNTVAKALENGTADAAFILAPLAMDLYNYGVPLRLILFAHKNGSCCVRNKTGNQVTGKDFFRGKSFYIPHKMSIHNMLSHIFFKNIGLNPGVTGEPNVDVEFEVVAPIKMPEFLNENEKASGYMVAEPIGTKAIAGGIADLQYLSSELWENHPCCVLAVQADFIKNFPDAVQEFASYIVQAGRFIEEKPALAAEIAVEFLDPKKELGLKVPVLKNVLTEPKGIKTNNLYPVKADLDYIQNYMHGEMGIGNVIDLNQFVDTRFADAVCSDKDKGDAVSKVSKIDFVEKARQLLERTEKGDVDTHTKAALSLEGKYLRFFLEKETFAIDILRITSIIRLTNITRVPNAHHYIKGVINLRGNIVPVIDLRLKIGLEETAYNNKTRIIIVEDEINKVVIRLGLIVDSVDGVYDVKAEQIESPPDFKKNNESDFVQAVVRDNESVFIILNLLNVMRPPHSS